MYKKSSGRAALGMFTLSLSLAAHAGPSDKADLQIRKQLASATQTGWSAVIVRTDGAPTAKQEARLRALGADVYRRLTIIDSLALRIPNRNLAKLAALPFVKRLSADMEVKKTDEFTVAGSGAKTAWSYGLYGNGIGVAVVDSGVDNAQDLTYRTKGATFVPGTTGVVDACGHGTHIAGIVAGSGFLSSNSYNFRTFYGIAPTAKIIPVKVLDRTGSGSVSQVIAGIQWTIANKGANNIRVMNLSLGHEVGESYTTDPLCQAVEAAWKSGIVVVCAAGNNGRASSTQTSGQSNEGWGTNYGSINSPGNDPYVITVGAMKNFDGNRQHDRIGTYSSRGPSRLDFVMKPDIVAPGNQVISLNVTKSLLTWNFGSSNTVDWSDYVFLGFPIPSPSYFRLSGTSMAAPVVSGAAALMLQANPSLSPDTVKARLMISADKWAAPNGVPDPCTYGAGYLNIPAALTSTAVATKSALSPRLYRDNFGFVGIDASGIMGGTQVIWGVNGVNNLQGVWGDQVIWGTQVLWGSQVIWGSTVWADQVIWGTNSSAVDLTSTAIQGEN